MTEPTRPAGAATRPPQRPAGADTDTETPEGATGPHTGTEAVDSQLTGDEARALVYEMSLDLYQAHDALAFVGECCDIADRQQQPVTTAHVREWLRGAQCSRQLAARATAQALRAQSERLTADTITDDALDTLYAQLDHTRAELAQRNWDSTVHAQTDAVRAESITRFRALLNAEREDNTRLRARLERTETEREQARLLVAASEMPGHTLRLATLLYPEVRAERDRARDTAVALENELAALTDQLAAVRALHQRTDCKGFGCDCSDKCAVCDWTESQEQGRTPAWGYPDPHVWPCPTIRALDTTPEATP